MKNNTTFGSNISLVADDFGVSDELDKKIVKAYTDKFITDISIIVNTPDEKFNNSINLLKEINNLSCGIHLCLFSGSTLQISPVIIKQAQIKYLISNRGYFYQPNIFSFLIPFPDKKLKIIEIEIRAQIERFLSTGIKPFFLNSHRNFLINYSLFYVCAKIAKEYKIPYIRIICEKPCNFSLRSLFLVLIQIHIIKCKNICNSLNIKYPDFLLGFNRKTNVKYDKLKEYVTKSNFTEIIVHLQHELKFHSKLDNQIIKLISSNFIKKLSIRDFCMYSNHSLE